MGLPREISQRELRNESGEVMRALEQGETFIVTRNGIPIGKLSPIGRPLFTKASVVAEIFRGAPRMDYQKFRRELDEQFDQDITPRG